MTQMTEQKMQRRTKIVATMGPAIDSLEQIEHMILAGVNVFRLNFSHGSAESHTELAHLVRKASAKLNKHIAIMGDLQGPKIRIGKFTDGYVDIEAGQPFIIDSQLDLDAGSIEGVGINFDLHNDCSEGQRLLLDDGRLELVVTHLEDSAIHTNVVVGGRLSSNKGLNLQGGGLSNEALTTEDKANIELAATLQLDYLAISFPTSADDIVSARKICAIHHYIPKLIAKIERAEVVSSEENLRAVIEASDGVMVARGDLGVEIGEEVLVGVQKKIIALAIKMNRVVITATQMMESMIENTIPTRAEVMDVANAVLDGTDAVMLSAETATGQHPVKVVEAMSRIIIGAEKHGSNQDDHHRIQQGFETIDESVALASVHVAKHLKNVKAIVCLTESGDTPLWMSRVLLDIPIIALSPQKNTLNRVALFRGVNSFHCELEGENAAEVLDNALMHLTQQGVLNHQDTVIATLGQRIGTCGYTDTMTIRIVD